MPPVGVQAFLQLREHFGSSRRQTLAEPVAPELGSKNEATGATIRLNPSSNPGPAGPVGSTVKRRDAHQLSPSLHSLGATGYASAGRSCGRISGSGQLRGLSVSTQRQTLAQTDRLAFEAQCIANLRRGEKFRMRPDRICDEPRMLNMPDVLLSYDLATDRAQPDSEPVPPRLIMVKSKVQILDP